VRLLLPMPASSMLSAMTSSISRWSSSLLGAPRRRSLGIIVSPGLYFSFSSCLSSSVLAFEGFSRRKLSSSVVTVAFGRVKRTEARHEGQVYGCMLRATEAWWANHSFKQPPQKECRQSSRVRGWNNTSLHIYENQLVNVGAGRRSWGDHTEQVNSFSRSR
jgi:hypothetical protein